MPTYEYICTACKHEWEASQSIKDEPLKKCPKCKKYKAKRQISLGGGFILKGGGWYADLYSSSGKSSSGSSSSNSSSGSGGSGSSTSGGGKASKGGSSGAKNVAKTASANASG